MVRGGRGREQYVPSFKLDTNVLNTASGPVAGGKYDTQYICDGVGLAVSASAHCSNAMNQHSCARNHTIATNVCKLTYRTEIPAHSKHSLRRNGNMTTYTLT